MSESVTRLALRLIGAVGVLIFGFGLALTYQSPIQIERAARGFIESRIEGRIRTELDIPRGNAERAPVRHLAGRLAQRHEEKARALRERISRGLDAEVAAAVARMQNLSCECRETLRRGLEARTQSRLSMLEQAAPQLRRIMEGLYGEIVTDLLRDLRIFTGINLAAFLTLLGISMARPSQARHLLVPAILLGSAALAASLFYVFGRNWFFTLLYADYLGWTYGLWLLLIFALFCDIVLFRARITARILGLVAKAPVPC